MFKLSDKGRTELQELKVKDNQITIQADAKTPYVVYKESSDANVTDLTTMDWSEGKSIKDANFDSYTWNYGWNVSSSNGDTSHVTYSNENETSISRGDTNALIQGKHDAVLSQQLTGLVGGQTYDISVYAYTTGNRKAELRVTTEDGAVISNFAVDNDSIYGSSHSSKKGSPYQRIKVQVTIPEGSTTAQLQLIAGQGTEDSYVRFDDVRVYAINPDKYGQHYYFDDFEDFSRGFGVFENYISGQNHMSEHSDFTDDVIDGRYSIKIQNFENMTKFARTVPSTLRLPTNTECTVSLDYLVSDGGSYTLEAVEGDKVLNRVTLAATGMGAQNSKTASLTFTTGDSNKAFLRLTRTNGTVILDNLTVDVDTKSEGAHVKVNTVVKGEGGKATVQEPSVVMGQNAVVNFQPEKGYVLDKVFVNGVEVLVNGQNTLTLKHQMEDAQVEATFKKDSTPTPTPTATPTPAPTDAPVPAPTAAPVPAPTAAPTPTPTAAPTPAPTDAPNTTPQTGDNSMLSVWKGMLATAVAALAGIGVYRRKKNQED